MARYNNSVPTKKPAASLATAIESYLTSKGFKRSKAEGTIWQKGGGMSNPMFVRFETHPKELKLEAWLRFVIFPGVFLGEYDVEGMFLIVQKRVLKKHVQAIEQLAT